MTPKDLFLASLFPLFMSAQVVAVKLGEQDFPPLLLLFLRFALMAAVLLPFAPIPPRQWAWIAVLAALQGALMLGLLFVGIGHIDTAVGSVVFQLHVPFSVLLAWLFSRERPSAIVLLGVALAFAGVVVASGIDAWAGSLLGAPLILAAAISMASGNLVARRLKGVTPLALNTWISVFAALMALAATAAFETGQTALVAQASWQSWGAVAVTGLLGGIGAFGIWYALLSRNPVAKFAPFGLAQPPCIAVLAWLILGETAGRALIAGGLLTLAGVAVVQAETMLKTLLSRIVETAQAVLHSLHPARLLEKRAARPLS